MYRTNQNCSKSIFQSPISIPNEVEKCNLLCAVDFVYPNKSRDVSVQHMSIRTDGTYDLLYVDITDNGTYTDPDIIYNGEKFRLSKIEFYSKSLHRLEKKSCQQSDLSSQTPSTVSSSSSPCSEQQNLEMCMYHQSFSDTNDYLIVSVFLEPMFTYSPSQDFFARLIQMVSGSPLNNDSFSITPNMTLNASTNSATVSVLDDRKDLNACKNACLLNNKWCKAVSVPSSTNVCDLLSTSDTTLNMTALENSILYVPVPLKKMRFDESWTPLSALPMRKSFFIYQGSLPYSPCLPKNVGKVVWLIMENKMPIHDDDYKMILGVIKPYGANNGSAYPVQPLNLPHVSPSIAQRRVLYNDGAYVLGNNNERDRFVVKCMKKEQQTVNDNLVVKGNIDMKADSLFDSNKRKKRSSLYETEVGQPLGTVVVWILFVLLFCGSLWYLQQKESALMPFMLFIAFFYYLGSGITKLTYLMLTIPIIFILLLEFYLLGFCNSVSLENGSSQVAVTVIYVFKFVILFLAVGSLSSLFSLLTHFGDQMERKSSYVYINASTFTTYISSSKTATLLEYGLTSVQYGLEKMHKVDWTNFSIVGKFSNGEPRVNHQDVETDEDKWQTKLNILNTFDMNMWNSEMSAIDSFKKAVMDNAFLSPKQLYLFVSNNPATSSGVVLDYTTIDDILKYQLSSTVTYLTVSQPVIS
jgi:carbonic anhydrase